MDLQSASGVGTQTAVEAILYQEITGITSTTDLEVQQLTSLHLIVISR